MHTFIDFLFIVPQYFTWYSYFHSVEWKCHETALADKSRIGLAKLSTVSRSFLCSYYYARRRYKFKEISKLFPIPRFSEIGISSNKPDFLMIPFYSGYGCLLSFEILLSLQLFPLEMDQSWITYQYEILGGLRKFSFFHENNILPRCLHITDYFSTSNKFV